MKKALKKIKEQEIFFYDNGIKKIIDRKDKSTYPRGLSGNINNGLFGKISRELFGKISRELFGNITGIYGHINTGLFGNISGVFGNCSNVQGDIDECEITEKERETLININDLIDEEVNENE